MSQNRCYCECYLHCSPSEKKQMGAFRRWPHRKHQSLELVEFSIRVTNTSLDLLLGSSSSWNMFGGLKNTSFMVAYLLMIVVNYRQPECGLQEPGTKDYIHSELILTESRRNLFELTHGNVLGIRRVICRDISERRFLGKVTRGYKFNKIMAVCDTIRQRTPLWL